MTTERIDIILTDKVDAAAEQKMLALAKASRDAFGSISELQTALAKGGNTAAFDRTTAAAARQELAQARLAEINQRVQLSQQRLATETQKTGTAYLQAESALNKAVLAEQRAAVASNNAATAQQRLSTETAKTTLAENQAALAAGKLATEQARAALAASQAAETQARAATAGLVAQQRLQQEVARTLNLQQQAAATAARVAAVQTSAAAAQAAAASRAAVGTAQQAAAQQKAAQAAFSADSAYQRLQASVLGVNRAQTQANTALTAGATAAQRLAAATSQAEAAQSRAASAALRLENAQNKAKSGGSGLASQFLQFSGTLFGVSKAYDLLMTKFDETQAYTNLQNKLRLVASGQADVQRLTNDLLEAANRSRAPLEEFGTTFQRINSAIRQVGGSQKEAIAITEALTKTISVSGKSSAEQASALLQVSQAFNKGKLDGDEFRTVMETLPEFADAITKALGLANREALFEASKKGKINLDAMREAMRLMGDEADKNLGKALPTVDQGFIRLKNSSIVLTGRLDEALGITRLLSRALDALATSSEKAALAQAGQSATNQLAVEQQKLAALDKQIEAKQAALLQDKAGVAGANALASLEARRAATLERIASLKTDQSADQSDSILARKGAEQQALNAKLAAAAAKAAADKEKADKAQDKRDASKRRAFEDELQRLREKTAAVGELTEFERIEAEIEAGKFKGVASTAELNEIRVLARLRDAKENSAKLDKEAAADQQKLLASREASAAAAQQETIALESQLEALQKDEASVAQLTAAKNLDRAASLEFISNLLKGAGAAGQQTAALDAESEALRKNVELKQQIGDQQFAKQQSAPGGLLEGSRIQENDEALKQQEILDTIIRLEQAKTITVEEGEAARARIRAANQSKELANTQSFFGGLAELASSKSKALSRIGKAAAITNATISGYEAVQNALAVKPYYLGIALAVGAAARTAANIQAIRAQGYQAGGYTGDVGISTPAGVVHGKEFVVNAAATRDNREQLESLNRGGSLQPSSPRIVVNNLGTPQTYVQQSVSRDEVVMIARDIANSTVAEKAPTVVANDWNRPSSPMAKSAQRNLNATRKY